jgi:hypothetical protein
MLNLRGVLLTVLAWAPLCAASPLPVRALHASAPKPEEIDLIVRFIREALPKEGVNTLVLEINYNYRYSKRPEVAEEGALSKQDLERIATAAREAGVKLIPMINMLGHQSWAKRTFGLLRAHPEFDETPGKYPDNAGIYCRSYCPLHPELHAVLFDLIDELMEVTAADAFHIGMDEVFLLGEDDCPRCKGRNKAELFAQEVKVLRDHVAAKGGTTWIWGDRFLDGDLTGMGKWEAATNGTADAIRLVPKDIIISDWHYERALPSATFFAMNGFRVVTCPWRKPGVALEQYQMMRQARAHSTEAIASRMLGMMQTVWSSFGALARAYFGEPNPPGATANVLLTFRELFAEMRAE